MLKLERGIINIGRRLESINETQEEEEEEVELFVSPVDSENQRIGEREALCELLLAVHLSLLSRGRMRKEGSGKNHRETGVKEHKNQV